MLVRYEELEVGVLHVTEELDVPWQVEGKLPWIPQSEEYAVTGLKGLREQFDMLLAALKDTGLMYSGVVDEPVEDKS